MTPQAKMAHSRAHPAAHAAPAHPPWTRVRMPREAAPPWGAGGNGTGGNLRSGEVSYKAAHKARPDHPPWSATVVPYLAVLVLVAAGVYISWHLGSQGGGLGGVIAGAAFLIAAGVRLALPTQLAGLLASRRRTTDVVTLVVFGVCLLLVGLVLPS